MLAVLVDRGATNELQIVDLATMKPRPLTAHAEGRRVTQMRWRPGSREVGFTLASVKSQGDVYSVDTSLGTLTRWTTSEVSFNTDVLPAPEVVEWKSTDGSRISGILYRPAAKFTGPRPVMVSFHGGPDLQRAGQVSGTQQLLPQRAWRRAAVPERAGLDRLRPEVRAVGQRQRPRRRASRTSARARLDRGASGLSTRDASSSAAGVTADGSRSRRASVYNDRIRGIIDGAASPIS